MMDEKNSDIKYDMEGFSAVTEAVLALVNQFPGLAGGESVAFATLGERGGMALFPGDGAVVESETRSVTGRVRQVCRYPFAVLYRAGGLTEDRRVCAKERLDDLGRWLARQSVTADGRTWRLEAYPPLAGGRRFLDLSFQTPAYLQERDEHQTETWAVGLAARYETVFTSN